MGNLKGCPQQGVIRDTLSFAFKDVPLSVFFLFRNKIYANL